MVRVFYATRDFSQFKSDQVVLLDDADPVDRGLIDTGYFNEIEEPARGTAEGAHRA